MPSIPAQDLRDQTVPQQPNTDLDKILADAGVTKEQFEKLTAALPKEPQKLPEDFDKKLDEERRKAFQTAQNQLYPTIEKQREDLNKIKEMLEKKEQEQLEAEAAKKKALDDEANKSKSFEEKLEMLKVESEKAMTKISETYESKLNALQQTVYVKDLSMIRKDLILDSGVADFAEFISDPNVNPTITLEQIQKEIEIAKTKQAAFSEKIRAEYDAKLKTEAQSNSPVGMTTYGNPVINSSGGNISGQQGQFVDLRKVATANKSELNKIKDELFSKFKFGA